MKQTTTQEADDVTTDLVADYATASATKEEVIEQEPEIMEPVTAAENVTAVVEEEPKKEEELVSVPKPEPTPVPVEEPVYEAPQRVSSVSAALGPLATAQSPSLSNVREFSNRFSTSYRASSPSQHSSRRASMLPAARTAADGPPIPLSAVTGVVRSTNPILDELLHSIKLLSDNDPSLTILDLKDCTVFTVSHGSALAEALTENTHLKELNLCNAQVATSTASELAVALRSNKTLEILNLESNAIAPLGIKHIAEALAFNNTLGELRLAYQKQASGTDAEQTFARSMQKNERIVKLGLQFRDAASRNAVDRAVTRNKEVARKLRMAQAQK